MSPEELKEVFSARVKELAGKRFSSVNKLADFAGVGRGYLSEVLACKKAATLTTIAKLAEALEVEPAALLIPKPRTRSR